MLLIFFSVFQKLTKAQMGSWRLLEGLLRFVSNVLIDGYYVAYKPITLSCILFMFIEMKFIHSHSCVMFAMKSMSMCND